MRDPQFSLRFFVQDAVNLGIKLNEVLSQLGYLWVMQAAQMHCLVLVKTLYLQQTVSKLRSARILSALK
jgi:hypothetical protein